MIPDGWEVSHRLKNDAASHVLFPNCEVSKTRLFSARRVAIGEVVASLSPMRLRTLLGSCVAVCLYDPMLHAGGMNHILVPTSSYGGDCAARFGVQAMELLINALMRLGADRRRFLAKAFGGGNVLPAFSTPTIGELNAEFVRRFLKTEGIPLIAERMGGDVPVDLVFDSYSGRAFVRHVDGSRLPLLVRQETACYYADAAERFKAEPPTIF
jgi:chemotaxis receptor (MCP) glutamine deamidase CheD